MRIGIDFDNTIVCYDDTFCNLAKQWNLIEPAFQGSKLQLRDTLRRREEGDTLWQRLQGKVYGEYMPQAKLFPGFKEFIAACNRLPQVKLFIVSHKTELGHFDENRVNLRAAARQWLGAQGFFEPGPYHIPEENVFFETTREEKIKRIMDLDCTHFIDDLIEVLNSPLFPTHIARILFQPGAREDSKEGESQWALYREWAEIRYALCRI